MATYEGYCVKCRQKREFEGNEVTNRMLGAKK